MKRQSDRRSFPKIFPGMAVLLSILLLFGKTDSRAAEYTYTVTFYPGNHGSFQGTESVEVDNSASGSAYEISTDGPVIRVSGLRAGDVVGFDAAMEGAVELEEGSRYYVKGIRVSGRDNSTVDTSAFRVEEDMDYVVAYGIRGDLTSYVVNYQDAQGNTLAPSRTYYGNAGDKPRIAYRYIEGYQPQAYNLTKTLSKNAAENVFTFTYTPVPAGETTGGTGGQAPGEPTVPAGNTPGQTGNAPGGGPDGGNGTPGGGQDDGNGIPDGGNGTPDEGQDGDNQNPDGGQDDDTGNPDENDGTPREEVDLDDQETPLGDFEGENGNNGSPGFQFPMWASVVMAVAGAAAVIGALCVVLATGKKAKNRTERHGRK
ncbi:MAG TPA: hypothetical protein DCZ91_24375 [Lachnospiraceae bacterium]|nr:hypothetical protein [Lachnospiraceae bacterium]